VQATEGLCRDLGVAFVPVQADLSTLEPNVGVRPLSTADRFADAAYHRIFDARSKVPGANDGATAWREQRFCV
jgi:hypothetical protein